ncbi:acyl-CoA thioesterase [Afipia massiliensis]|uniref:Acyl-CoA thioesterase n=1 Tax=Afipia massiliensis TaxID=211460 RepID=A0A840N2H5_9BRAD|nr:acyl-CoA thioesterase [Afipia massiliensis]
MNDTAHPFDRATQVTAVDGRWRGTASEDYFAFVGLFGGATAATMLRAIMVQPERIGDPLSVTVNLCAPVAAGGFDLSVRLMKATRSTQHWMVELLQDGEVAAFITAVFAVRRPSWSHQSATMPEAPAFDTIKPLPDSGIANWVRQYQFRFVEGMPSYNKTPHDVPASAYSRMWLSDTTPRQIDFLSLLSMSDTFFARIFHVRGTIVPIGTVSMTTAFHADAADLAAEDITMVLGAADANVFHKSFADQIGQLWSPSGRLLATTSQAVYFKA